ncbi:hypothetical protein CsSME_00052550 [Camellia sinensis var. sinensis]
MGKTLCCQGHTPPRHLPSPRYGRQRPPPFMECRASKALLPMKWRRLQTERKELSQTEITKASARLSPSSLSQTEHEELSQTEITKASARLSPSGLSQIEHEELSLTKLTKDSARLSVKNSARLSPSSLS